MIVLPALRRAVIVGTVFQVILAASAHFSEWIAIHALLFGGMLISSVAGYLYALDIAKGFRAGAYGGTLAGGASGFFGIALSITLGDTDPARFLIYTLIYTFTGAVGGVFGQSAVYFQPPKR